MPIPDFQSVMLPALRVLEDGNEHVIRNSVESLADDFALAPEERDETHARSGQSRFAGRVHWAITYLSQAGLVERTGRGRVRITPRGLDAIRDALNGSRIDMRYLEQFQEYQDFRARAGTRSRESAVSTSGSETPPETTTDPSELLEASYRSLRAAIADDLLNRIKAATPRFFERLVLDLLIAMGYGGSREDAAQAVGGSGDDGIDGIIKEDKLGLDSIYLQAKRWEGVVGRPVVQGFAGSLQGHRARKGVFITTSKFSQDAKEYVNRIETRIVLIDGAELADLMIEHGVGVTNVAVYAVKKIDEDYFDEA